MKLYKKIDILFNGTYLCTTQQSKTCKEAKRKYLESIDNRHHSFGGIGLVDRQIRTNKELLKARFQK